MKIEIVTHAYAERVPFYGQALVRQLSSLVLYPPSGDVRLSVCCAVTDTYIMDVLNHFAGLQLPFQLFSYAMPIEELGRRSIGRNKLAKKTDADIVWFTDVDYVFRGCLENLAQYDWSANVDIVFPRYSITSSKSYGNQLSSMMGIIDIDPAQFIPKEFHRATGAVQIVRGVYCREHGYLDSSPQWRRPTSTPFQRAIDDVRFRRGCRIQRIDLPGVYRIQNSKKGRHLVSK